MNIECVIDCDFPPVLREATFARVQHRLARHAREIDSVSVAYRDLNGPRGGVDLECRIHVRLKGLPDVLVRDYSDSPGKALFNGLTRVESAMQRTFDKHRSRRIRRAVSQPLAAGG